MPTRIRINFVDHYPSVNGNCSRLPSLHVTRGCPRPGLVVEILTLLTNYLNLTVDAKIEPYHSNFTYMLDAIYRNETDLYAGMFINTTLRAPWFDFTEGLYQVYTKIAVKKTDGSLNDILSFFNVYRWDAWLSMILVFILFTLFGLLVRYAECQLKLRKSCNCGYILWKMIRFQLVQSKQLDYKLTAGSCSLLVFSLFQICIILGLFQGFILSSVVKKKQVAPFTLNDDFPQMIKDKKLFIVTSSLVDWFYQEIETSYVSPFYELRNALKYNNYTLVKTTDDVLQALNKGDGAVALMGEDYPILFKAEQYCNLAYVHSSIPSATQRLMFKKGNPFVPLFDKAILANRFKIEKIKHKYLHHKAPSKCAFEKSGPTALTIMPYYGLLILFVFGISLSLFIFGAEIFGWTKCGAVEESGEKMGIKANARSKTFDSLHNIKQTEQHLLSSATISNLTPLTNLSDKLFVAILEETGLPPSNGYRFYVLMPQKYSV